MAGCAVPGLAAGRLRQNHRAGERPGTRVLVFRSTHPGKLNIEIVELKWGQGAKDIGGEVGSVLTFVTYHNFPSFMHPTGSDFEWHIKIM